MIPPFAQYVFIMSKKQDHAHGKYKRWQDWEKNYLRDNYAEKGMKYCAKHLRRTPETVQQMARRLKCCIRGYFAKERGITDEISRPDDFDDNIPVQ